MIDLVLALGFLVACLAVTGVVALMGIETWLDVMERLEKRDETE